jgi:hypothetical protein
MTRTTVIYGLADPFTGHLRYIGKTATTFRRRFDAHLGDARRGVRRPCADWIGALLRKGSQPEMFEIEACPPGYDWEEAEQFWIAYFRSIGCNLLNLAIGGGGALGWQAPPDTKKRMSAARMGKRMSEETKQKIGAANSGRPHTEKQRQLNGDAHRGEKSPTAKLAAADIPFVRALRAAGYSGTQVAKVFGITKQNADSIFYRETWAACSGNRSRYLQY